MATALPSTAARRVRTRVRLLMTGSQTATTDIRPTLLGPGTDPTARLLATDQRFPMYTWETHAGPRNYIGRAPVSRVYPGNRSGGPGGHQRDRSGGAECETGSLRPVSNRKNRFATRSNRCLNVSVAFPRVRLMADHDSKSVQPSRRRGRPRASEVAAQLGETGAVSPFPDGPADADGLTLRQRRILEMIKATVESRGYPPSIREMGDAVGLASSSSVAHQLKMLEAKGLLRRDPNRPRALEVLLPSEERAGSRQFSLARQAVGR